MRTPDSQFFRVREPLRHQFPVRWRQRLAAGTIALWLVAPWAQGALTLTPLAGFNGTNGARPFARLVQARDGNFYGTTSSGGLGFDGSYGSTGLGTVFRTTADGTLTTLFAFGGTNGLEPAILTPGGDGTIYGAAELGGPGYNGSIPSGNGTLFQITTNGALTNLLFFNGTNGNDATGLFTGPDGSFYGITARGGVGYLPFVAAPSGDGTVFKLAPDYQLTTLAWFGFTNGFIPEYMVQGTDGNFYGVTVEGGANDMGTVFRMAPGGTLTSLFSFNGTNGSLPAPSLVEGGNGDFYGATTAGGTGFDGVSIETGKGTLFKLAPDGKLSTLIFFNGTNGGRPSDLIRGSDGNFYGITTDGGAYTNQAGFSCGTIFRMTPQGELTTLFSFNGTNGFGGGQLMQASDGNFYGVTQWGGPSINQDPNGQGYGTVFRLSVPMPPLIQTVTQAAGTLTLSWSAVAGQTYQVQASANLAQPNWTNLGLAVTATNGTLAASDAIGVDPKRFYRVILLP